MVKNVRNAFFFFIDIILLPVVYFMSYALYVVRTWGIKRFRLCNRFLLKMGILPTRDYFYKPTVITKEPSID